MSEQLAKLEKKGGGGEPKRELIYQSASATGDATPTINLPTGKTVDDYDLLEFVMWSTTSVGYSQYGYRCYFKPDVFKKSDIPGNSSCCAAFGLRDPSRYKCLGVNSARNQLTVVGGSSYEFNCIVQVNGLTGCNWVNE